MTPPGAAPEQHTPGLSEQEWEEVSVLRHAGAFFNGRQLGKSIFQLLARALTQRETELAALHAENEALREELDSAALALEEAAKIFRGVRCGMPAIARVMDEHAKKARALLRASVGEGSK